MSWFRGPSDPSDPKTRIWEQVVYLGSDFRENGECVEGQIGKGREPLQRLLMNHCVDKQALRDMGEQSCAHWIGLLPALPASPEYSCGHRMPSSKGIQMFEVGYLLSISDKPVHGSFWYLPDDQADVGRASVLASLKKGLCTKRNAPCMMIRSSPAANKWNVS